MIRHADDPQCPKQPLVAPRGPNRTCQTWAAEAALRLLHNNLEPDMAEHWQELVVYGGIGRAARSWPDFHRIVRALRALAADGVSPDSTRAATTARAVPTATLPPQQQGYR